MPEISLLLPTRGRPHLVRRFFQSLLAQTASLENIEVVLYLDHDDTGSHDLRCDGLSLVKIIGPQSSMGAYMMACLNRSSGDLIILMNDDVVVRTPSWDSQIVKFAAGISDGIFLAYGNDLHMGKRMCTFPILSRKTCEIMIQPYPEEYLGGFIDWHLFDLFKRLKHMGQNRIFYLHWLVFEHLHVDTGKAEPDPTYQASGRYTGDWPFVCLRDQRQAAAKRLRASIIGEPLPALQPKSALPSRPSNSVRILLWYASVFLLDFALPIHERLHLFAWMTARYLRHKGYLPPKYMSIQQV